MKTIEWDESLALGIREIDDDHRNLIGYYNDFFSACYCSMGPEVVKTTLRSLDEYARNHFHREELLMEREGYPGLAEQKKEHENLLLLTLKLQEDVRSKAGHDVSSDTFVFLRNWLLNHFLVLDAAFVRFVRRKGQERKNQE